MGRSENVGAAHIRRLVIEVDMTFKHFVALNALVGKSDLVPDRCYI